MSSLFKKDRVVKAKRRLHRKFKLNNLTSIKLKNQFQYHKLPSQGLSSNLVSRQKKKLKLSHKFQSQPSPGSLYLSMNLPRWLYKKDLFQLTLKVNLIKRLLEQLVKQELLRSFYLRMIWRVMARKNRNDKINSLNPWAKCNLTHNQWTKFQCNKAKKNLCSKVRKNFLRKQKVETLQRHGRNVKRSLENYKNWLEIIVNQERRTQKHKMKKRNLQNL